MQNPVNSNPDPLLSTEEAATYLSRHPKTLINDRCNGNGPRYVRLGRLIRYKQSALDEYINQSEVRGLKP
jgi:predicted DNA-binding transcriptional regulator AlpA